MAYVIGYSSTENSIQWEIGGLMYPASQYANFRLELWRGGTYITTINWTTSSSNRYTLNTFYNLLPNTTYTAKAWSRYDVGGAQTYLGEASYSTKAPMAPQPPGSPGWINATADQNNKGWIDVSWGASANTDYYIVEIPSIGYASGARTTTSASIGGLAEGTTYTVYVYAYSYSYGRGGWNFTSVTTKVFTPPTPGSISWVTATPSTATRGRVTIDWASTHNVTRYRVEIWSPSGSFITSGGTTGTSFVFTGLAEYTQYYAKVYGQNTNSNMTVNGPANDYNHFRTADVTGPSITNLIGDGQGRVYVSFNASDSMSGIRSTSSFYIEISNANGTVYGNGAYTTIRFRTFTADSNGNELVHGAFYTVRVTAYDASNNATVSTLRIQYQIARPTNWTWHGAKTAGGAINTTAAEWNSFVTRINQFRMYKNLSNYNFTTVYSGNPIRASEVNQARDAIAAMTSVPAAAIQGSTATAAFINGLSERLNAIA